MTKKDKTIDDWFELDFNKIFGGKTEQKTETKSAKIVKKTVLMCPHCHNEIEVEQ